MFTGKCYYDLCFFGLSSLFVTSPGRGGVGLGFFGSFGFSLVIGVYPNTEMGTNDNSANTISDKMIRFILKTFVFLWFIFELWLICST